MNESERPQGEGTEKRSNKLDRNALLVVLAMGLGLVLLIVLNMN